MALEDQIKEAPQEDPNALSEEEEVDTDIAVTLAKDLIDQGGYEVIEQAIEQSSDPAQVIGQFLLQLGDELGTQFPEQAKLSPRIWLAQGGVLEQVSDYLQEEYDVEKEVMDRAEVYVASTITDMAASQESAPQPVEQGAPAPGLAGQVGGMA